MRAAEQCTTARVFGDELAGLLGEIEQDGIAVEDRDIAIDDGRRLGVHMRGFSRHTK